MPFFVTNFNACLRGNTLFAICYGLNIWSSHYSYIEILTPMLVLGNGVFERWLAHKNKALINGVSALTKEIPERAFTPFTMWGHGEKMGLWTGKWVFVSTQSPGALISDFSASRSMRDKCLIDSQPVYAISSQQPEWSKMPSNVVLFFSFIYLLQRGVWKLKKSPFSFTRNVRHWKEQCLGITRPVFVSHFCHMGASGKCLNLSAAAGPGSVEFRTLCPPPGWEIQLVYLYRAWHNRNKL